jgi:hypothetical protein
MEETIITPRLELTMLKTLEKGSKDLEWAHLVRSNELASSWR